MNRVLSLMIVATLVTALRADARACSPIATFEHTVDPSMQATDHTPPTLPVIPPPEFHYADDSSDGIGCGPMCTPSSSVGIPAVATDDTTNQYRIGYRLTLESGTLPPGVFLPTTDIDPTGDVVRVFISHDATSMDFTLRVVAIDLAGNESAPQTVRVEHHPDSECSIAGARPARPGLGWIAIVALIVSAYRRPAGPGLAEGLGIRPESGENTGSPAGDRDIWIAFRQLTSRSPMNRLFLLVGAATVVAALPVDARACDPVTPWTHMLDTSMQATDHTPPTLPAIPPPQIHFEDDPSVTDGCSGKCGDGDWVGIPAVATDDTTDPGRIGYRLSLASGTIPQDMSLPLTDIEPLFGLVRVYFNRDTVTSWDFTVQVIAIDLAGNESAPQIVRLQHSDSGCAVTGARRVRFGLGWLAFLALIVTAYRRRRP